MVSTSFSTSLTLHSENTVQGGSCDPQTLGGGNVIFHRLVDAVTADHQHMRTAKVIMRHIHAVLVFLGDFVLEEGGQKQYRTDRRISGVIYLAAVVGGILGIFILAAAPGSCDVSKGSFHGKILSPGLSGQQKTAVYQPPAYIS